MLLQRISPRQRAALKAIRILWADLGYAPSIREFQEVMGYRKVGSAAEMLNRLEKLGLIKRVPGQPRTLQVTRLAVKILEEEHEWRKALSQSVDEQIAYRSRRNRQKTITG